MFTVKEWEELLYTLGLQGQLWLHVNHVAEAYVQWRTEGKPHEKWGQITEEKLAELLAEPHFAENAVVRAVAEEDQRRIIKMLHYTVAERRDKPEAVN